MVRLLQRFPTICGSRTVGNDLVELIGTVCLQNSLIAFQNFVRIDRVLRVRVVVQNVGMIGVSTVHPDETSVRFAESIFHDWQRRRIGLDYPTVQNELMHSIDNGSKKIGYFCEPPAHGRAIEGNAQRLKYPLLAIEGQVKPKLVGRDLGEQTRSWNTFVDWLVRFLRSDNLASAFFASIFVHDVLNVFEQSAHEFDLVRDFEPDNLSSFSAARAVYLIYIQSMFLLPGADVRRWSGAAATMIFDFDDVKAIFLGINFIGRLRVNGFAGAGQKCCIDFGGLAPEGCAIATTQLLLQFGNAGKQFLDQAMAIVQSVWQFVWSKTILRRGFRHDFVPLSKQLYYRVEHRVRWQSRGEF